MLNRLAKNVQVRKESWGLLFYSSAQHKIRFIKSGNLLYPGHFDGTWTFENVVDEVSEKTGSSQTIIKPLLEKAFNLLKNSGFITKES